MKHQMVHARALLTVLGLLGLLLACSRQGIEVSDAWIREAPPGSTVLAGYLTIHNHNSTPVTISGVSGEDFSSIEIHRIVTEDGMSRMQRAGALQISPGERFVLEPGGYHLMLFNPTRQLQADDSVTLLLEVKDGDGLPVQIPVVRKQTEQHH